MNFRFPPWNLSPLVLQSSAGTICAIPYSMIISSPPPREWGQWPCPTVIHRLSGECMFMYVIKPVSVWLCLTTRDLLLHQHLSGCSLRWMKCKFWALTSGVGKIVGVSKSKLHCESIRPPPSGPPSRDTPPTHMNEHRLTTPTPTAP